MKAQVLLLYYVVLQFANAATQKNVLLMFIDDGGFEMGVYGNKVVNTPNIDNFAKKAVVFKHGFTSVSSCSPSRSALLTGIYHLSGIITIIIYIANVCILQVYHNIRMECMGYITHSCTSSPFCISTVFQGS